MRYGCIGESLKHSFSAELHPHLSPEPYELCEIPRQELDAWMEQKDFCGINVTIPYKQAVIPHLTWIDPQASEIGAVNTVLNKEGKLYGYNTDFYGMTTLLSHLGAELCGKKVAILGTGGTSLTAMAVCKSLGAKQILRVSRSGREDAVTYEMLAKEHRDIQILINTTPCGMYPHPEGCPVELSDYPMLECVADAVYNPLRTNLVLSARQRGIPAEGGLLMLVAQAVRAAELFHGCTYPAQTVTSLWQRMVRKKENIVLIGMPGCGKSTVGRLLAQQLGREFCDMDEAIAAEYGKKPSEILLTEGEPRFREIETELLEQKLSLKSATVIATGGGAIIKPKNEWLLRQNGRIFFLDRHWQELLATDDRPLSGTPEKLQALYAARYGRYTEAADCRIASPKTAEEAVELIKKEWMDQ